MKRYSSAASLALGVLTVMAVLGLAGPVAAGEQVPFRGTLAGMRVSFTLLDPQHAVGETDTTGEATQLGQYQRVGTAIVTLNDPLRTAVGNFQFVAANGDTVTGTFTGISTPTEIPGVNHIVETATITGGTGRFAGATGGFTTDRLIDLTTLLTVGSFEGTISTPGS
jgi:hypothetical protein